MQTPATSSPPKARPLSIAEQRLITALRAMVIETMAYPPERPYDLDSFVPARLIEDAQDALDAYGMRVAPEFAMMANGVPA